MRRPDTWSDQARPGQLKHHSARGSMPRNAGNFTRGSQLITHEFLMWFASAKMPLLVWFFTFLVALSIVLALLLHEHEVQMILMRIYAAGWSFMEFNPRKILNLTLPSGEVIPAPISMIASHPESGSKAMPRKVVVLLRPLVLVSSSPGASREISASRLLAVRRPHE